MTEFVITLPIFITIFVGINGLGQLQQGATQAHFVANRVMWETAMEVMESEPDSDWGNLGNCNTPCVLDHGDAAAAANTDTNFIMGYVWGTLWYSDPRPHYDDEGNITHYFQDVITPTAAHPWIRRRNPRLEPFLAVRSNAHVVTSEWAWGAGSRYGEVEGVGSRSVTVPAGSANFEFSYFVTAPSRPLDTGEEAMWTVAKPRLSVSDGLLGLKRGYSVDSFEFRDERR